MTLIFRKVRTFWETHKIKKNLPHGFDQSADLLNDKTMRKIFSNYVCFSESPNFTCLNYVSRGTSKYITAFGAELPNTYHRSYIIAEVKKKREWKKTPFSVDMIIMFQIWFMTGKWQKLTEKCGPSVVAERSVSSVALGAAAAAAAAAVSTLKMTWFKFHPLRFSVWLRFSVVWLRAVGRSEHPWCIGIICPSGFT